MSSLCQRYRSLPVSGGVLDQPVWIFRMHRILELGTGEDQHIVPGLELADLQELLVG